MNNENNENNVPMPDLPTIENYQYQLSPFKLPPLKLLILSCVLID